MSQCAVLLCLQNALPDVLCVVQVALEGAISKKAAMNSLAQGNLPTVCALLKPGFDLRFSCLNLTCHVQGRFDTPALVACDSNCTCLPLLVPVFMILCGRSFYDTHSIGPAHQ